MSSAETNFNNLDFDFLIKKLHKFKNLSELLSTFGGKFERGKLHLEWDTPDQKQFKLLIKLLNGLTNLDLIGRYNSKTKQWIVEY